MARTNGKAEINATNLAEIARGRPLVKGTRISPRDQSPTLQVIMDRRYMITPRFITNIIGRFDPDHITYEQMRLMRRHPMVAFAMHFLKAVLLNAEWHIECSDPRVGAFTDAALRRVYAALLRQSMTSLEFGFAPIVKRFGLDSPTWVYTDSTGKTVPVWDNRLGVQALVWKKPRLMIADHRTRPLFDGSEEFDGFEVGSMHRTKDDPSPLQIDREYAFWYTNELDESRGDLYGYPRTGYALQPWWSQTYRHLLEDRHFEQDADPPLMIRVPPGTSPHPETGEDISNRVLGVMVGSALRDGATVVMDSQPYVSDIDGRMTAMPMWDAKFLTGGENLGAFRASSQDLNVAIMRALWVPEQALIGSGGTSASSVGARRAVEMYGAAFVASQSMVMSDFDRELNDHFIPDLVQQNFTDPPECRKITTGFNQDDMGLAADLLKIMVSQAPQYSQIDWRKVAANSGLPLLSLEEQSIRDQVLGKLFPKGAPADAGGQTGETGGVGNSPAPQQKVREAILAALFGDADAEELLTLSKEERWVVEQVNDLFARSTSEGDLPTQED
jgi:hypothetical protein